jgi:hypothetical protein
MRKTWLWIVLVVLVLGLAGELAYYFGWPKINQAPVEIITASVSPSLSVSVSPSVKPTVATISDAGVTWVEQKKLNDLGLNVSTSQNVLTSTYYKVADLVGGGEIILNYYQEDCPCSPLLLRFKKDAAGVYSYLINNSDLKEADILAKLLPKSVTIDSNITYASLSAPDFLTVKGETLKGSSDNGLFSDLAEMKPVEVEQTSYGKIYQVKSSSTDSEVGSMTYKLKLADGTYRSYTVKFPFMTDDEVAQLTWSDGSKNVEKFTAEGYVSCGRVASNNSILDTTNIKSRLTEAGYTDGLDKVYKVAATDAVAKSAYENYKIGRDKDILTIDEFVKHNTLFVWQSKLGTYFIFTNRNYGGLAECGKPVIYLYPEKTTEVSVKVDAKITKSDPIYNNGWTVVAEPTGLLTVAGKIYNSLFWEGTGADYPQLNQGVVVKTADAISTIKTQLSQLGLNEKEIADFVEFWAPKMPSKPYVRLTWFGTSLMDKLAPLTVNPKPDTTIRVFLDFEGLDKMVDLKPQILSARARTGFTLIEWGGLLR